MKRKPQTPTEIARFLTEDAGPGKTGLTESLYGHRVANGPTPFDKLLLAADMGYLEFDINDQKFQSLAKKYLGNIPDATEWQDLITNSSQSDELKNILISKISGHSKRSAGNASATSAIMGGEVVMKRGTVIKADAIEDMGNYIRIGIKPGRKVLFCWRPLVPGWYEKSTMGYKRRHGQYSVDKLFENILSANRKNVQQINWDDGTTTTY